MTTFLIILGICVYLIIGRVIINTLQKKDVIDTDNEYDALTAIIIFPLLIAWIFLRYIGDLITNLILHKK